MVSYWLVLSVFLFAYLLGSLVSSVGQDRPAYTIDMWLPIGFAVMFWGFWFLGFLCCLESDPNRRKGA